MTRAAGIDCGTNSVRLLIAEVDGSRLTDIVRELRIVRLGQGVDRTGRLAADALERTRRALVEYHHLIERHDVTAVRMVATSATRDAENRQEFHEMVHSILDIEPEVVTGHEEAALSFAGAVRALPELSGDVLLTDIGGGSTELVRGRGPADDGDIQAYSMDVGCVRMTERHLFDDPPTAEQVAATVADVNDAISQAAKEVSLRAADAFVGVAGTVTTVVALARGLPRYEPRAIHAAIATLDEVNDVTARLLVMTHAQRATLPVMHPGRVDVIGGGALVLRTLMAAAGADSVIASEHDILDGITLSAVDGLNPGRSTE